MRTTPVCGGSYPMDRSFACCGTIRASRVQLLEAIRSLCYFHSDRSLTRVNYRDMDTEELGSIYESLLELHPEIDVETTPWTFRFIGEERNAKAKGSERKLTGSYYTPPSLVQELIKSALEPVLKQTVTERPENPKSAILDLKILDPACGSGHFLLAAARRMAVEIARIESGSSNSADEILRQHALREVVQHCIYGVDRNPLAVELCKAALWIETVEPGKPLTFLDSHIQLGNSLVGIMDPSIMANGIPKEAYNPLPGDDKSVCRILKKRNSQASDSVQGHLFDENNLAEVTSLTDFDLMPEDMLEDVERKGTTWKHIQLNDIYRKEKVCADMFVGVFLIQKDTRTIEDVPITQDLNSLRIGLGIRSRVEAAVTKLANQHLFFHWHLAFADIMQRGGFDVVLGNPPWEQVQLDPREFFATKDLDIAEQPNMAARNKSIQKLAKTNHALYSEYQIAVTAMKRVQQFIHSSGQFPKTSYGRLNSSSLFAELSVALQSPYGRTGIIVPTGIATDSFNQYFFTYLVNRRMLVSLYSFENREKVFPGIDGRINFCLLTLSGTSCPYPQAKFSFFLHRIEQLQDLRRQIVLSGEDFALFNPNTRTCPIFRTQRDMEIARKMYSHAGVFWKEAQGKEPEINPWGINFQLMFMMNTDSHLFRTREQLQDEGWQLQGNIFSRGKERYLPLYEAKLIHQYDHRFATFDGISAKELRKGKSRSITSEEKTKFQTVAIPRYWVPEEEVSKRLGSKIAPPPLYNANVPNSQVGTRYSPLALRNIARSTDARTGVISMIPFVGLGHSGTMIIIGLSHFDEFLEQQIGDH